MHAQAKVVFLTLVLPRGKCTPTKENRKGWQLGYRRFQSQFHLGQKLGNKNKLIIIMANRY